VKPPPIGYNTGQSRKELATLEITLSLPYNLTDQQWKIVDEVYRSMDGWVGSGDAQWYGSEGDPRYIWVSSEPSGLLVSGNLPERDWTGWLTVLCARLSLRLGFEVRDAEM
jgi:hypothetical protein